jgi:hypothetical protein
VRTLGRNNSAHEQRSTARGSPQRTPPNMTCVSCVNLCQKRIAFLTQINP